MSPSQIPFLSPTQLLTQVPTVSPVLNTTIYLQIDQCVRLGDEVVDILLNWEWEDPDFMIWKRSMINLSMLLQDNDDDTVTLIRSLL
mmetsp:Transcript_26458/g.32624  ORF Transcript_26458/g.32624 Transcript_26458/m.32624 type:complete len:87 (-) Transcript_26458:20-280(-)